MPGRCVVVMAIRHVRFKKDNSRNGIYVCRLYSLRLSKRFSVYLPRTRRISQMINREDEGCEYWKSSSPSEKLDRFNSFVSF